MSSETDPTAAAQTVLHCVAGRTSSGCDSLLDVLCSYQAHRVSQEHRASVWSPNTEQ